MDGLEIGLCWGTLQNAGLVELIEAAARHGFPTLSVRPDMVAQALADGLSELALRRRLADAGVRVRVIDAVMAGLPGLPPHDMPGDPPAPTLDTCLKAARAVEAAMVNVAHYGGEAVPQATLVEALQDAAERAAAEGFGLVLEFIPGSGIPDLAEALALTQGVDHPACRVLVDTWHLIRSGGTAEAVRALPSGALGGLQLSDRTPPAPGEAYVPMTGRKLPGEGEAPLHAIVAAALANTPGLTAEVEVFSQELRDLTTDAAAARVAAAVRSWRLDLEAP